MHLNIYKIAEKLKKKPKIIYTLQLNYPGGKKFKKKNEWILIRSQQCLVPNIHRLRQIISKASLKNVNKSIILIGGLFDLVTI